MNDLGLTTRLCQSCYCCCCYLHMFKKHLTNEQVSTCISLLTHTTSVDQLSNQRTWRFLLFFSILLLFPKFIPLKTVSKKAKLRCKNCTNTNPYSYFAKKHSYKRQLKTSPLSRSAWKLFSPTSPSYTSARTFTRHEATPLSARHFPLLRHSSWFPIST